MQRGAIPTFMLAMAVSNVCDKYVQKHEMAIIDIICVLLWCCAFVKKQCFFDDELQSIVYGYKVWTFKHFQHHSMTEDKQPRLVLLIKKIKIFIIGEKLKFPFFPLFNISTFAYCCVPTQRILSIRDRYQKFALILLSYLVIIFIFTDLFTR